MKKTKKQNKKLGYLFIILIFVVIISAALLIYIYTQNYINVEYVDKSSNKIEAEDINKVKPIIINNVVAGGITDTGKWVNTTNFAGKLELKTDDEIDMYTIKGKMGTFKIHKIGRDNERGYTYIVPFKDVSDSEYIAIAKSEKDAMARQVNNVESDKKDEKYVKKALGRYRLFNNTVKVNEVYEAHMESGEVTRIISATASGDNMFGVYSTVVFVRNNKAEIIKYSYVKNTKSALDWPVYSVEFMCDLNSDGNYELVIQETKETKVKYSVLEYKKNKYYEVLGFEFKI